MTQFSREPIVKVVFYNLFYYFWIFTPRIIYLHSFKFIFKPSPIQSWSGLCDPSLTKLPWLFVAAWSVPFHKFTSSPSPTKYGFS